MTDTAVQAILVVGPAWVGDMVMAQSLFRWLARAHPGAAIDVVAPAWSHPLLARMPEVREAIELPLGHGEFRPLHRYRLGRALRPRAYDWAIVLPITWKAALLPFGAGIARRTGFIGEQRWGLLNDLRRLDKQRLPMMVQRYLSLARPPHAAPLSPADIPAPRLSSTPEQQQRALARLGLNTRRPVLAFCPGAEYGPAKRWPAAYFAAVGRDYLRRGWQVWVLGSAKDRAAGAAIVEAMGGGEDLTGKTHLQEVIDLLALSDAVVCNDSGLMHIAAAVERRVYAIYGSSDPGYTPPLSPRAEIISLGLECSPCFKKECPLGHYRCLRELQPERVLEVMGEFAP